MDIMTMLENVIERQTYDLNGILRRIDQFYAEGKLELEEREALIEKARAAARHEDGDLQGEITALWAAVRALQAQVTDLSTASESGENAPETPQESVADWHEPTGSHDAYFAGDIMRYTDGFVYRCTAPQGAACVWSPSVMPTYWEVIPDA